MAVTSKQLVNLAVKTLEDGKAENIQTLDVRKLTSMTDYMVIATGRSSRQVKALAEHVAEAARQIKHRPLGIEGEQAAEWVLVDLSDVIVHVMQAEAREFYQLEKLWEAPRAKKVKAVVE